MSDGAAAKRDARGRPARPAGRLSVASLRQLARQGPSFRLRLVAYLVLFALVPVGAATWAIARQAAASEAASVDATLNSSLRGALEEFADVLDAAQSKAEALAANPSVERALSRRDVGALRRIARASENTILIAGSSLVAGAAPTPSVKRSVEVISGERSLGYVVVAVPLDGKLLAELRRAGGIPRGDRLAIVRGETTISTSPALRGKLSVPRARPQDVEYGGSAYRAVAAPLLGGDMRAELVLLRPRAPIAAAARSAQLRVALGGLVVLAAIALIAYGLAPAIARGRMSQQQRAQAARVLTHVGDGVMLVDSGGTIRFWNPAAEAMTGLTVDMVSGRRLADAIPGWETVRDLVPVATRPGELLEPARARTVPLELDGRELWLSVTGVQFPEGTVYTFRDLTEERRLEELKSDFVATVSHELRTPLAAVYGAAMILQERGDGLSPEAQELLGIVSQQSDRLSRLVDDILLAGQLGSGRAELVDESFDAAELARSVIDETPRAQDGISIELVARPNLPRVAGDGTKVRQVLSNLVENAIKYSPDGGRIEVELTPNGESLRFAVRDQGLGIPPGDRERIFEKFYRVDPLMRRGIGGTGLGLYICRELIAQMRGRIWVTSQLGAGATFTFELPLADGKR